MVVDKHLMEDHKEYFYLFTLFTSITVEKYQDSFIANVKEFWPSKFKATWIKFNYVKRQLLRFRGWKMQKTAYHDVYSLRNEGHKYDPQC